MKAYQIKIELIDSKPLIWRRVIIPADVTFKRVHDTIQFSMDWWVHEIKLEKIIEVYRFEYPTVLDGEGVCSLEDVGGIQGYAEFLKAWNNLAHEEHEAMSTWGTIQH